VYEDNEDEHLDVIGGSETFENKEESKVDNFEIEERKVEEELNIPQPNFNKTQSSQSMESTDSVEMVFPNLKKKLDSETEATKQ
jgi:hypothetical protein